MSAPIINVQVFSKISPATKWIHVHVLCGVCQDNMHLTEVQFIKGNDACINMVANILPIDPLPRPFRWGQKVKIQLFQNIVMLHISN